MNTGDSARDGSRWGRRGSRRDRRLGAGGEPRMPMLPVSEIRKGKPCQTPTVARRQGAQPTLFGHTERRWIDMRCTHIPSHEHPPDVVTYSPDNPSATKYHCPDLPCGAKPENTPYTWITTSVAKAHRQLYTRCRKCFKG